MKYAFENAVTCADEKAIAISLPREDLVAAVRRHSWDGCVASTMGAIADRADCPLLAVLFMFDLGDAAYHANREQGDPEMFDLFLRIQNRINAGGYTHDPKDHLPDDSPSVDPYLDTAATQIGPWALSARIVAPALERPAAAQGRLTEAEEQTAQEIFAAMKEAAPGGEAAVKPVAMRAVLAGRRVEKRVAELIDQQPRRSWFRKKWPLFVIWGVFFWLMWPTLQRMFLM